MNEQKDGGPAFPQITELGDIATTSGGMSLRDWFAGQALAALLSSPASLASISQIARENNSRAIKVLAEASYEYSDAMLAAREAQP